MNKQSDAIGRLGEARAEAYLASLGMTCLCRRYRAEDGELDLVMEDGDTVVFVEVKAAPKGRRGDGLLRVTPGKQRRMTHAAQAFLQEREWMERMARFDVVEITGDGCIHVPGAFEASCGW